MTRYLIRCTLSVKEVENADGKRKQEKAHRMIHTYIRIHTHTYKMERYIHTDAHTYICLYSRMHTHICMRTDARTHTVHTNLCIRMFKHKHKTSACTHIHVSIYTHACHIIKRISDLQRVDWELWTTNYGTARTNRW